MAAQKRMPHEAIQSGNYFEKYCCSLAEVNEKVRRVKGQDDLFTKKYPAGEGLQGLGAGLEAMPF